MTDPTLVEGPTDPVARRVATEIVVSILVGGVAPYVWTVFYVRRTRPRIEAMLDRAESG